MRNFKLFFIVFAIMSVSLSPAAVAENKPSIKATAALSDYVSKVEELDRMVRDLSMTAAVLLLGQTYQTWTFEKQGGFGSNGSAVNLPISNDLTHISSKVEQAFIYVRGHYSKNEFVSDAHRHEAVDLIGGILLLVETCRDIDGLVAKEEYQMAGAKFRNDLIPAANDLAQRIRTLADELNLQIKFSAL